MGILKVLELVGTSSEGPEQAVREAVAEAVKTIRGINRVTVSCLECVVDDNLIVEWRATVKLTFPVERG